MILKDLIDKCNVDNVINKLIELYPDQVGLKEDYINLIKKLKNMEPNMDFNKEGGQLTLFVSHVHDIYDSDDEYSYEDVSGYSFLNNTSYACEFTPHCEWLAMLIAEPSLNHYGIDAFLAHVLWEMSFVSFDDDVIEKEKKFIVSLADEARESVKDNDTSKFKVFEVPDEYRASNEEMIKMREFMRLNEIERCKMLGIDYDKE